MPTMPFEGPKKIERGSVRPVTPSAEATVQEEVPTIDILEQSFLRDIEQLRRANAGELASRWEDAYDNLDDGNPTGDSLRAFFKRFAQFKQQREDALFSMEVAEGLDEELVAEVKEFDRNVVSSFGKTTLFQGNGATAEVYEVLGHPRICVKFITNQDRYNENNHIRAEFGFLRSVSNLEYGRVRSPKPYFLRTHPTEGHSYGMEKVEGKSLSQLLEKPDEAAELVIAARQFDRTAVYEELSRYLELLHERGITHNDIRLRNMMFDHDGNWFVIDYGKAKRDEKQEVHEMHRESDLAALRSELHTFFAEIDKLPIQG